MSTAAVGETTPTYGNFRKPASVGLWGMSLGLTLSVFGVAAVVVLTFMRGAWIPGLVIAGVGGSVIAVLAHKDVHGLSVFDKWMEKIVFGLAARRGRNVYRSGAVGVIPGGATPLPGVLAPSRLSEHVDSFDRPFALVHHGDGSVAVVMSVSPPGIDLVDRDQVNMRVAQWGEWLAMLGNEVGVVQASVVVETSPDSGQALERHIRALTRGGVEGVARQVMNEVATEYRSGAAQMNAWVTLTFQPSLMSTRKRDTAELARDLGGRLTGITQQLKAAGAGAVRLVTARQLARLVRAAYDPAATALFEEANGRGDSVEVAWEDAGPIGADAAWDSYRHDSGLSRTWVVSAPPSGVVHENVLERLLRISSDVERKRVTLLYRPISSARTGEIAERDQVRASNLVTVGGGHNARALREARIAERNAAEEAAGAGIEDFALIVSATVTDGDLEDASSVVRALCASSKLPRIRIAYGAQDSAFALGLPLGLRPASSVVKGL